MQTLTSKDAKRNLDDDQASEVIKADYLKHCFNSAKEDLAKGNVVDGEYFLNDLKLLYNLKRFTPTGNLVAVVLIRRV